MLPHIPSKAMIYGSPEWEEAFNRAVLSYESAIQGMTTTKSDGSKFLRFWCNRDFGDETNQDMLDKI